ncbi:hypothetical protein BDQ17DRAFT_1372225 [Cyathus striatus]|nr:hypothetical protein BDQ17DRAFT_1372225 [Cyathus striatus]
MHVSGSRPSGPRLPPSPESPPSVPATPTSPMPILSHSTMGITGKTHVYSPIADDEDGIQHVLPIVPNRRPHMLSVADAPYNDSRLSRRSQYLTISEAVHDSSQPEFDPERLYPIDGKGVGKGGLGSPPTPDFRESKISPSLFPLGLPKPSKKHPFSSSFEAPNWRQLLIHVVLCLIAYPILQIFVVIARNKSLFWSRLFVGAGCGLLGFVLGVSLLQLGRNILEAATWATVIHQSKIPDGPGVRLRDLAVHTSDATSSLSALRLLWDRNTYEGAARDYRRTYDRRPWTLFILFFLLIVGTTSCLSFVFGRVVTIKTNVMRQGETYEEIGIKGDMSDVDIQKANELEGSFNNTNITWTLAPFSAHGGLPSVSSFTHGNDTVYFAETIMSQLLPDGSGFGTFDEKMTAVSTDNDHDSTQQASVQIERTATSSVEPGSTLRFPKWGIRIKCARIPDGNADMIPRGSSTKLTYVFVPRDTLQGLFSWFEMPLPANFSAPLNMSNIAAANDTLPATIKPEDLAMSANFTDNGVAHSLFSYPLTMGEEGNGWQSLEVVLVRMNTIYAPNGTFLRNIDVDIPDGTMNIGYDAAICLELYEPWVVEVYNSTVGAPSSTRIVGKGPSIVNENSNERLSEKKLDDPNVKSKLNSTGLEGVVNKIVKVILTISSKYTNSDMYQDNGRDAYYVPSPTILSYCDAGEGAMGYTVLSEDLFAISRAMADASNVLPYFVGSGDSLARSYSDRVLSTADIEPMQMIVVLIIVLFMGVLAALFVPKLPLALYSWMAAFYADELVGERPAIGMGRNMEIQEIAELVGNMKFRYVN